MADRIKNYQQEADQITTLKAIRTDLGVTPSSYTPDATVVTKDRVVTFAQAEEELVVLSDIEKGVKQQIVDVDITQKDIANIKALLQGHLYDYQTDSTSAYTKSVPSGAMPYAGLEKIGGKTVVFNQSVRADRGDGHTSSSNGVTYTWSDGGLTITANGTAKGGTSAVVVGVYTDCIAGHKYLIRGCPAQSGQDFHLSCSQLNITPNASQYYDYGNGSIFPVLSEIAPVSYIIARVNNGTTVNNVRFKPQFFDLTLMFGSGNEPSTVAEFEAMFPAETYPFSTGTLLSAGVTSVVSKDTNNATLQTYSIPASIQALEGYGWSAGTAYNYVDFERKMFVQNVARVDLGSLTWEKYDNGVKAIFASRNYYLSPYFMKIPQYHTDYYAKANIVCKEYINISYGDYENGKEGIFASDYIEMGGDNPLAGIGIYDTTKQSMSVANFKTSLDGVYLYYELATPIEVDVSQYLTDDNLINVEAGGTLTFENQHGDDYRLPVPSEETYMIDLQEAINNG